MMGIKERHVDPIDALTLDDLVPTNHLYRYRDRAIDLSFVRDLVADCYASCGEGSLHVERQGPGQHAQRR